MLKKTDILFYKEVCSLVFVIAAGLSLIVICIKLANFTELILASPNVLGTTFLMFFYLLPAILTTVLPVSVFTASTLITMRMNSDKELDALFSSGMSIRQFFTPTFFIGVGSTALMLINNLFYEPYAQNQFRFFQWYQTQKIVESFFIHNIKEHTFISNIPFIDKNSFVFYSDSVSTDRVMSDIFIGFGTEDFHTNDLLMSQSGRFLKSVSNGYPDFQFALERATIYSGTTSATTFKTLNISLLNAFGSHLNTQKHFSAAPYEFSLVKSAKPISMAFCLLCFPALGVCLGAYRHRQNTWRIYLGIACIIALFYSSYSLINVIISHSNIPIALLFSIPPIFFGCLTFFMAKERQKIK